MTALVDKAARLAAMANLAKHFLSQTYEGGNTAAERGARHEAIKREVSPCGLFDAHDVVWLFYLLEERGVVEINKFAALAQTTDPEAMRQHGIPKEIVDNANMLKEHHRKASKDDSAANARASKPAAMDKDDFQAWAKKTIQPNTHSGNIQIDDVRGMKGFKVSWGQSDVTLKRWLKEAIPGFSFKRGAKKK
jgi:hypothetical protein